jgi:putative salt-induced outer membrane protein
MFLVRPINTLALIGSISLMSLSIQAAEPQALGFSGSGEAGYNSSTGNTTTTSMFGAIKLNYNQVGHELKSILEVNYKSENDIQTQERYLLDLQRNHFYNEARSYYSYVGGKFENSRFENIDLDAVLSVGLGKTLYQTERTNLTGELGLGYQSITYTSAAGGNSTDQIIGRLKLDFNHQINEQVTFTQDALLLAGSDRTKLETNTGLKVKVANSMNVKLGYKYRHNDKPATASLKKTDTQTTLTLIYDF